MTRTILGSEAATIVLSTIENLHSDNILQYTSNNILKLWWLQWMVKYLICYSTNERSIFKAIIRMYFAQIGLKFMKAIFTLRWVDITNSCYIFLLIQHPHGCSIRAALNPDLQPGIEIFNDIHTWPFVIENWQILYFFHESKVTITSKASWNMLNPMELYKHPFGLNLFDLMV